MRISDWSSDVCSSDLVSGLDEASGQLLLEGLPYGRTQLLLLDGPPGPVRTCRDSLRGRPNSELVGGHLLPDQSGLPAGRDRTRVVVGEREAGRLALGVLRMIKKTINTNQ